MVDTSSIDAFLAGSLRALRRGDVAEWNLGKGTDWQVVWSRIEFHGIALLLHNDADRLVGWSNALLERMAEEARLIVLWETTHRDAVIEVLRVLDNAGVEAVLMKGTALAYSFHSEPAARRRGDTDLLVRPTDQARTRECLTSLGWYRKDDPHGLYYQEGWLHDAAGFFVHSIDLHWEPSDRPVLHGLLPIERFFAGKQAVPRLGEEVFRPDNATMILHGAINQEWHAQHGYHAEEGRLTSPRRLIWSVDFDLLARSMSEADWEELTEHCIRSQAGPLVAKALLGARDDLGTELPENALTTLNSHPLSPDLQAYFTNGDSLSQFWLDLSKTKSWRRKSYLLATRAFPPRTHLLEKYPSAQGWPTVILQARMLLDTARRLVRKVAS